MNVKKRKKSYEKNSFSIKGDIADSSYEAAIDILNISAISFVVMSVLSEAIYFSIEQFLTKGAVIYFFSHLISIPVATVFIYKINSTLLKIARRLLLITPMFCVCSAYYAFYEKENITFVYLMGAAVLIIMLMYVLLTKRNILSVMFIVAMGVVGAFLAILIGWYLEYSQIILSVIISALLPWSVCYTYNNLLKNPS